MPQRTFVAVLTVCAVVVLVAGYAGPAASSASRPIASALPPSATQTPPGTIQTLPGAPPSTFGGPPPLVSPPATPSALMTQPSLPLFNGAPNQRRLR